MTRVIYKYPIDLDLGTTVTMIAKPGDVLHFTDQGGRPTLWILADPRANDVERTFSIVMTGQEVIGTDLANYVGTCQIGAYVLHCFEGIVR